MEGLRSETSDRVGITGVAAATGFGVGVSHFFSRLQKGFQVNHILERTGGQAPQIERFRNVVLNRLAPGNEMRTDDLLTSQLLTAVKQDLGALLGTLDPSLRASAGVVIGNWAGNFSSYFKFYTRARDQGPSAVHPIHFPATLLNYPTAKLNAAYGLMGSSTTISTGCSSGLEAIEYGIMRLCSGEDQIILAGGIAEINEPYLSALEHLQSFPASDVAPPACSHCPGPEQGVGVLLLETLRSAQRGRREVLGEILSCGTSKGNARRGCDHLAEKAAACIDRVLQVAGMTAHEVEAIFSSTTGCVVEDAVEAKVLATVFGTDLASIPVYPIKPLIGECVSALGPLQCIAAVYALTRKDEHEESAIPSSTADKNGMLHIAPIKRCNNALICSLGRDHTSGAAVIASYHER